MIKNHTIGDVIELPGPNLGEISVEMGFGHLNGDRKSGKNNSKKPFDDTSDEEEDDG